MPISFHSCLYGLLFSVYFGKLPTQGTVLLKKFQSLPGSESVDRLSLSKVRSEAPLLTHMVESCFLLCSYETFLPT